MTNEQNLKYRRDVDLGLKKGTSAIIQNYFDSYPVMRMATKYTPYRTWGTARRDGPYCYMEVVKKAGLEYDALSHEKAVEYLSLLKERRDYRLQTGTAMVKWQNTQLVSRAREIAAEKDTRFQSIKANLVSMGWEEKDFPMDNKAFRELVLKDQKLTPKVWQNIKPKLEPMLEKSRLERERRLRRLNREDAVRSFYHPMSREITDLPFDITEMGFFPKHFELVMELPPIKALLENDTETITEEQWAEVAPGVRLIAVKWWRDSLKQLVDSLENGSTPESGETNTADQGNVDSETETMGVIFESIEALKARLSKATSVFSCTVRFCRTTACFHQGIMHTFSAHGWSSPDGLFSYMQPLRPEGQTLVKRLLKDLHFDPVTVNSSEVVSEDQSQKDFLCTRCDKRVARYMTFGELIQHYLDHQKWFENVTEAVQNSPDSCYPSWPVDNELPTIVNDHDWIYRDELLVRKDDYRTRDEVIKLQKEFLKGELNDPTSDTTGVVPLATGEMKLHIQMK
ncbi:hypothetical protein FS837_000762 [Tulasnella sp. UAMH 9824]|nr:hypothetical protein FS837_000762 [Tulasnella sp. UAMH 9824]